MIASQQDNSRIITTRQFLVTVLDTLHKINPELLALLRTHSEGGGIGTLALKGMTEEQRALAKQHLLVYNIAPAIPIPEAYAYKTVNVYSKKDYITKQQADKIVDPENYNIQIVPSITPWYEQTGYFADHAIMGRTYQKHWLDQTKKYRVKYGFYDGKDR